MSEVLLPRTTLAKIATCVVILPSLSKAATPYYTRPIPETSMHTHIPVFRAGRTNLQQVVDTTRHGGDIWSPSLDYN
ncbi:hypothetical protein C8R45DRAFT_1027584 [Mycena sanguinolenta]|nr:hypothetical protein C8R45DRAFT_1027584 [Mycena sanguinolenta]